jgi:hypothetical protein
MDYQSYTDWVLKVVLRIQIEIPVAEMYFNEVEGDGLC